jgi:hypothetical protein
MNLMQRFYLSEMANGTGYSWLFLPTALRRKFEIMMEYDWCALEWRTFEGDTQKYRFLVIRPAGLRALKKERAK